MDPANSKEHEAAMLMRSLMTSLSELVELANDGAGYEIIQRDIGDLESAYFRLGTFVHALQAQRQAAE